MQRNCKMKLETIKRNQGKLENSFAKMKAELKAVNSKMNNAEERISDLEDRLGKYPVKRADRKPNEKKKQYKRPMG